MGSCHRDPLGCGREPVSPIQRGGGLRRRVLLVSEWWPESANADRGSERRRALARVYVVCRMYNKGKNTKGVGKENPVRQAIMSGWREHGSPSAMARVWCGISALRI